MRSLTTEAIVVGLMDYREADRIVHLYTAEYGRMSGIARGAKKSVKRFAGAFELFARLSLNFIPAEGLATITSAEPLTIYPDIRTDFAKIAHASYAVELVAVLTPEKFANKRVFRLLAAYLKQLDTCPVDASDRHFFEINLLNILGYRPPLESCSGCGAGLATVGGFRHSGGAVGILCSACSRGGERIEGSTLALMIDSLKTGRFGQISFNPKEIAGVERLLESFIAANISRPLKSLAFL